MVIVRGQGIFPSRIEDVLRSLPEFGEEFRLVVEREPGRMDSLTVLAEVAPNVSTEPEVEQRFAQELRRAVGVSLSVELRPPGEFERTQFKARRIIDRRQT